MFYGTNVPKGKILGSIEKKLNIGAQLARHIILTIFGVVIEEVRAIFVPANFFGSDQ